MKKILIISLLMCSFSGLMAQPGSKRMTKEQIFNQKWEFIVAKSQLSAGDAAKVQPLFFELEEQIWQLFAGNRQIFRSQRRNNPGEKVDFEAINDAIIETELSKANLQKVYYLKLKKVVDAETINKIFHAEKAYQKDIIQKIPSGGRPGRP
ncbi:MAG: hypothetical protein BGP01_06600 [Paludibacter sp. 47-17]|jgi:hypothetical protein|nr:MAG: hypothetical protein BGP01_06600 [Paludibacter sp. 47-17]